MLAAAGWDVERDGLVGAPPVEVVGAERHVTIDAALRLLGLGGGRLRVVPADDQGRMDAAALPDALAACQGPAIVCAQADSINTSRRPAGRDLRRRPPTAPGCTWTAFGLWAAASPARRHLVAGAEQATGLAGHRRPQVARRPL